MISRATVVSDTEVEAAARGAALCHVEKIEKAYGVKVLGFDLDDLVQVACLYAWEHCFPKFRPYFERSFHSFIFDVIGTKMRVEVGKLLRRGRREVLPGDESLDALLEQLEQASAVDSAWFERFDAAMSQAGAECSSADLDVLVKVRRDGLKHADAIDGDSEKSRAKKASCAEARACKSLRANGELRQLHAERFGSQRVHGRAAVAFGTAFQTVLSIPPRERVAEPSRRKRRVHLLTRRAGRSFRMTRAKRPPPRLWLQPVARRDPGTHKVVAGSSANPQARGPAILIRPRQAGPFTGECSVGEKRARAAWLYPRAGPAPPLALAA